MKRFSLKNILLLSLSCLLLGACATQQAEPPVTPSTSPTTGSIASPVASAIASVTPSQPETVLKQIGYGLSYGHCGSYCNHSLTISAEQMRLVHKANRDPEKNPDQVSTQATPAATWQKLTGLASFETLQSLPERIGCPDCADGGAEWIELEQAKISKRVTFEPQEGLPQQAELLAELRKLYQELNGENNSASEPLS